MLEEHLAAGADLSLEHALSVQSSAEPAPHPAPQAAGVWCTPAPSSSGSEDLTRRCRHAVSAVGPYVFMFGGLRGSTLLDDFLLADDSSGTELSVCDPRSPAWCARAEPLLSSAQRDVHAVGGTSGQRPASRLSGGQRACQVHRRHKHFVC